jgi:hypothetical protein
MRGAAPSTVAMRGSAAVWEVQEAGTDGCRGLVMLRLRVNLAVEVIAERRSCESTASNATFKLLLSKSHAPRLMYWDHGMSARGSVALTV